MKYVREFRDAAKVKGWAEKLHHLATKSWVVMEICGGQTHSIVKFGLSELIPDAIELVHGPGCPVCVTPLELIDKAIALAKKKEVIFCSFGDMLRVPGSDEDLLSVKAGGGDVRVVYSPLDALKIAAENPSREVVFFSVGFETTAPTTAMAVHLAKEREIKNFSLLASHVLVPPAMELILSSPESRIDGFLAAGHVCTVMGFGEYEPIAEKYSVPIVVTGFEPLDILQGLFLCIKQLEEGRAEVENQYRRSVKREGNPKAKELMFRVFQTVDRTWRGIGEIPRSGLGLRPEYEDFDAEKKFNLSSIRAEEPPECRSGEILQGRLKPYQCPAFGKTCTPENPLGAPMVSSEGACSAYYLYRRQQ